MIYVNIVNLKNLPGRSVINIVYNTNMQVLCKGTKVFVVVQEATVVYFRCRGDDDVHSRDGYALASEFISGGIDEEPTASLSGIVSSASSRAFIASYSFLLRAALEQFKNNNICGGDREGVKRC